MRSLLTLICLALIACAAPVAPEAEPGGSSAPAEAPSGIPPHQMNADQCQAVGGTMRPVCMMGNISCVVRYADAGRVCSDGDDCQGNCRAESLDRTTGPITGRCQETSDPCGCFANVEDGRVDAALCVD